MRLLFPLNDPPYGTERCYNALRLARALARAPEAEVRLFLMGDAVVCAKSGQKVPAGYYNVAERLGCVARVGAAIGACGTCLDARGVAEGELVAGVHRGSLDELAAWSAWADQVITF